MIYYIRGLEFDEKQGNDIFYRYLGDPEFEPQYVLRDNHIWNNYDGDWCRCCGTNEWKCYTI